MTNDFLRPIWDAFEKYSEKPAVVDKGGSRTTTYRELGEMAKRVAQGLIDRGIAPGSGIPVQLPNEREYLASELGIWMAGHSIVPAGMSFPEKRVKYIMELTEAPLVITPDNFASICGNKGCEEIPTTLKPMSDVALIIFTSGSTGTPKGICHTFDSLLYSRKNNSPLRGIDGLIWGSVAPFYFIASMWVFDVLVNGGVIHLYDEDVRTDVRKMEDYIAEKEITHTFISPSVLSNFKNHSHSLKVVISGSEKLTRQESRDGYTLINSYGLSETVGPFLYYTVYKLYDYTPVGKVHDDSPTECRLVNERGEDVAHGETGELIIRGMFTSGYYKNEELTHELYRDGWLHTGDLMRYDDDGNLIFVNRKDWMVKINGQRVEPGEVENVMKDIAGIKNAIVKGFEGENGRQFLCGYFIGDDDVTADGIKKELREKLPAYMIPSYIVRMDSFPLLPNGKTDRKSLHTPSAAGLQAEYVAPETPAEHALCAAFAKIFNIDKAGVNDDFFAMGGDSINVMRLQQLCPTLDLSSKIIYKYRTPREIAGRCESAPRPSSEEMTSLHRFPLTQTQMGIYAECMMKPGEAVYNIPFLMKLGGNPDGNRLANAVERVIEAHPFLMCAIEKDDEGNPVLIHRDDKYTQKVENISEKEFESLIPELIKPFTILGDRLFRIRIMKTEKTTYLFMDFHHLISDGTSMRIFIDDLNRAYRGETVDPEKWSGFDVSADEKRLRDSEAFEEARSWYDETFGSIDIDSKPIPDRKGGDVTFGTIELTTPVPSAEFEKFCKSKGVTPNIATIAVFGKVLGAYTNMSEAVFATIYNGRSDTKTSRTIDMLVKTLPVYCRWSSETGIEDYLAEVKRQIIGSMTNDLYSFAELASATGINSDVLFAYQGDYLNFDTICGEKCTTIPLKRNSTGSALNFQVFIKEGKLSLNVEYREDQYSAGFITDFMKCYSSVLESMMKAEQMSGIELTDATQLEILDKFNDTSVEYDSTQTVVSLFEKSAGLYPDNTAIIYKEKRYTYREVDELSAKIAVYLREKGLKDGHVVSILIPRSEWMVIASLGVLRAGCAYQPLDSTYPKERLNFMTKDSGASMLITTEELRPIVDEYNGDVLYVTDIPALDKHECPKCAANPSSLFTLLYTSGSTGIPKGVRLTHANLVCFINWYKRYYALNATDCVGAYASYGFDANMMDMYPALATGACVCIIPEEIRLDMEELNAYVVKNNVTHLFMTTQVGRMFATDIDRTSVKYLNMGGEKLISYPIPASYKTINLYGPTECTINSTAYLVKGETEIPIGKIIDNVKGYVVSLDGKRLPVGAIGELWIAGPNVADGYLNRPDKTAEVFIKNPFDGGAYEPLYRTGDIVRYMSDGNLEFIGRRDGQVKIRGFRIELSEVEAVVREFPGIKDATVAAFDHPSGGKYIAAYVVSDDNVNADELAGFIRERKPPYMVPAVTMQIDSIPLNQNYKVNRRALPKPEFDFTEAEESSKTLNILEQELHDMAVKVTGIENIGIATPLINAGLTSILSIKLASLIYKRFGIEIPSKILLGGASLENVENTILNEWINPEKPGKKPDKDNVFRENTTGNALSFPQTGVYFECMKRPADIIYNIPALIKFDKSVSQAKLSEILTAIVKAHPSLETRFEMTDSGVVQIPVAEQTPVIEQLSMTDSELDNFKKEFVKPFKLSSGPLYRFAIVSTESSVNLLADFHHLVFDGTSLDIFIREIGEGFKGNMPESETYTYQQYVADEKEFEKSPLFEENRDFYASLLAEMESASEISADLKGKEDEGRMMTASVPLDIEKVENYAKEHGLTAAAVMLAATFYTVSRFVNSENVYLSTISSGRSDVRVSDTFGMFVNTLPLGIKVGDETVEEFIAKSGKIFRDVIDHEKYPFAKIAADFGFRPGIVYEYQLGVVNDNTFPEMKAMEGLELRIAKFKISIHIEMSEGRPSVVVYYNDALYRAQTAENLAHSIVIAAEKMIASSGCRIRNIDLIDGHRAKLLDGFHTVATATPQTDYFHEGVEKQAGLHPDRIALIACDGKFTYSEFDAVANRIANNLIGRGVEPRSRIAIMLPRTSRMIMSMFGVMKAGSAYIPCDPEYPTERIQHILNDSNSAYIITTADKVSDFPNAIDVETLLKGGSSDKPAMQITPQDLAYLIYTSGSTGKPKGVMLRHESIANYLTNHPANRHIHALAETAHTLLSITTVSFDMSLKEIGAALFNGLTLVFADENQTTNPILLAELFKSTKSDAFNTTPSRMLQFMELPAFVEAIGQCKVIMCGGEKYADGLLDKLRAAAPEARIFNTYGPTEITVSSNAKDLTHSDRINIGKPLLNVTEFIADKDGNELPPGIVGELYIGGMGVATGYNDLPEMTAERFIDYHGLRIYKSGDYARWTDDGDVEVLGRTDNQIKLRGLRIELGEIEAAMAAVEGIRNVVVKIGRIKGEEHLCAYFTADRQINIPELKAELSKTLTKYMVPTAYLQMEKMPLTPNGKTDVKSLPEPQLAQSEVYEAPENETEQAIADIFAKILQLDKVGATDNFYELGGTSLVTTRVIIETDKLGYNVAYGDVFAHPTPRKLANFILGIEDEKKEADDTADYDYSAINSVLKMNTLEAFRLGERQNLGDILLTGATGYLGIHILKQLIDSDAGNIYCMVRGKDKENAVNRLKTLLFYYFEDSFENLFGPRLHVIAGDVTDVIDPDLKVDTVINCAAIVKHFSEGTEIEDVNVGGAQHCVDFCLKSGARMIQVSTASTRGFSVNGMPPAGEIFNEQKLYIGQFLGNKYIHSKFIAERIVLEAVATQGLSAKIMRVGNLSARSTDGEFQANFQTNSFMGRLKVYNMLGCCPYESRDGQVEFSPINEVARAIVLLSTTPKECVVFHPYNNHFALLGDVLGELKQIGGGVRFVEMDEFSKTLDEAKEDPQKAKQLSSMLAYRNMANGQKTTDVIRQNAYTMQVLYRLGYKWSLTSWDYVDRFFTAISGLGFFDE